jgi:pimeloyl-ACP methyl ester carboxylesterase
MPEVCPRRILDRQTSSQATILHNDLPSYEVLDEIVERYVEHSSSLKDLTDAGFDPAMERFRFTPGDLTSWPGRILILESDEDLLTPEQCAELRRCYPRAGVYKFRGAVHTPWMSHKEEYLSVINEFLHQ